MPNLPLNSFENTDADNWIEERDFSALSGNETRDAIAMRMWTEYLDYLNQN